MITIHMKNITSKVEGLTDYLKNHILKVLTFTESSYGQKTKFKSLFNKNTGTTYTGLIPHITMLLDGLNIGYIINDLRTQPVMNGNFKMKPSFQLRDYQQEIVDNVSSRDIIQAATGAGKTFIMASLIVKQNVIPVIVIAPSISLAFQIKNEFEKFLGVSIGLCGGGFNDPQEITVSTPGSVPDDLLKRCKMILWDEFHGAAAEGIWKIGIDASEAYYRYGMSATPWRDDGKDMLLESITNIRKPHLSITASKLIGSGKLSPCTINFIQINEKYEWEGSYEKLYKDAIVNNQHRNNIIAEKAIEMYNQGRTTLILIKNIKHGQHLLKLISEHDEFLSGAIADMLVGGNDNPVQFISGGDVAKNRETIIDLTNKGKVKILIASTIADQGLDLPILDCLILAGGGKSSTKAFQRIGRVIRTYPNKKDAIVFDFKDMTPTLYNHYLHRKALYETESLWKIVD